MRRVPTFVKLARTQSGFKGAGKEISHPRYVWKNYQNGPQEAHFEHFGGTGPDMARMGLTRLILSTLAPWAQIWPSAEHFGALGPNMAKTALGLTVSALPYEGSCFNLAFCSGFWRVGAENLVNYDR